MLSQLSQSNLLAPTGKYINTEPLCTFSLNNKNKITKISNRLLKFDQILLGPQNGLKTHLSILT